MNASCDKNAEMWQPTNVSRLQLKEVIPQQSVNIFYLSENNDLLAPFMIAELAAAGFLVHQFTQPDDLELACEKQMPAAVIINVNYADGKISGIDVLERLKNNLPVYPPTIMTSVNNEIEARLEAVRAGANRYLCKPLDVKKLIKSLDGMTSSRLYKSCRVLLIDPDIAALKDIAKGLSDEGMEIKNLSNSMDALKVMADFIPDVIIADACMPGCSGAELAQIVRRDDAWANIPIILTSSKKSVDCQLNAMKSGGDYYFVKPVNPAQLLAAINTRVERVRWTERLNSNLQSALRESEFQLTTMNLHDIVSTTDVAGRITSVNHKFCEISGYSREELLGRNHRMLKSKNHPESFYQDLWRTISSGEVWHGTICNYKKNGDEYWVESTIVPFLDDKGKPYKYVSARTDITALRQSEERLQRSQVIANIGTWDWNIVTGELFWSDSIGPLFGYNKEVPETNYENFLVAVHSEDRQFVIDSVNRCVERGIEYNIEHRVVWPDGSVHWVQETGDVIRDDNGKPLRMLGVVMDIDKRKATQTALVNAKEEAEEANRAKSQFLSSMSHELRTPLNAIIGFSQLLKIDTAHALSDNQVENVDEIYKAGNHLLDLINEVLDLARIEAGRIDLSIEPVALSEVVADSIQLITPLAQRQGIEISLRKDGTEQTYEQLFRQGTAVNADRTRLRQVLLNLLSNAVKYNHANGKLTIDCDTVDNEMVRIGITDTGNGLTLEQQAQLFKSFERIGEENSNTEGTGIGLVITKSIVELMGGNIGVDSEVGVGSTFWIELPLNLSQRETEQMPSQTKEKLQSDRIVGNSACKYTVLYIEDNPANLRLVTQLLGRIGNVHMWSAHEPVLGLELAAEHKPDLILLDINLPGMDGFEVLKRLRRRKATRDTPVIAISANAMHTDIEKGKKAGFDDYITKPINVAALMESVSASLKSAGDY